MIKSEKKALFETVPVGRALLTMAIPTVVSQLITMIYNLADTFFIGMSDDDNKMAAASIASILFFMLNALANLFGVGGGSLLSRLLGEKREDDARRVGAFSIYGSLGVAALYSVICFIFMEPLARLLGATDNTLAYTCTYLFWVIVVGGIPSTIGLTMSYLLRSAGYSKESGIGLAIGGVANIILDPLLMFVLLPAGEEVKGAAIATMLSNLISLLYYLYIYFKLRGKSVLSVSPKLARIERDLVFSVLAIGLPSALTALLANVAAIIKNNLTSGYGETELAAFGIVVKLDMIPLNIGMGLCQGMMPLVAYNYASGNYDRMKRFARTAQIYGMATAVFFILLFQIFAGDILWVFTRLENTIALGASFLRIACLATPFMISNFQKIYCLQAMGKGGESLLLGVLRQGLIAIPAMLLLNHFVGLYGVVAAQLVSDCISFFVASAIYRSVNKKLGI